MVRNRLGPSVDETVDSTRHQNGPGAHLNPVKGRLACVHPPALNALIDLGSEPVTLGRSPEDLSSPLLQHKTVSRSHLRIEWDPSLQTHVAQDLGSRNGSAIDGESLGSGWAPIKEGSVVRVGDVLFIYEEGHTLEQYDPREVDQSNVPGNALAIQKLRAQLSKAAPDISPALIIGETGTGKEKTAYELHRLSGRSGEFVAINCATLSEQLIESQLFGHVKGAFTGANTDQPGLFRAANGGTLFLDEIGEMPLSLQPKLLRAIQEREIRAVGSTKNIKVDVRVVAATHRNLAERAQSGEFRQDLYARLALWQLNLPALRLRRADILFWMSYLHSIWNKERGLRNPAPQFSADAAQTILLSSWSENLRGLNRFVHELATDTSQGTIRPENLPEWIKEAR